MSNEDDILENDKQEAIHLWYIQYSGETYDPVENYLDSRLNDPASEVCHRVQKILP